MDHINIAGYELDHDLIGLEVLDYRMVGQLLFRFLDNVIYQVRCNLRTQTRTNPIKQWPDDFHDVGMRFYLPLSVI